MSHGFAFIELKATHAGYALVEKFSFDINLVFIGK